MTLTALGLHAPVVMGVLNVTPDSFSDGGRFVHPDAALAHGRALVADGADVIDVGGESTRPGAALVSQHEEQQRVLGVVAALAAAQVRVSIDTMHASTARLAVEAGAVIVNDVSGGLADDAMLDTVAALDTVYLLSHWRGHLGDTPTRAQYGDVVADVRDELAVRVDAAVAAGIARDRIVLDPGLGFSKVGDDNWALLARLPELDALGLPVLIGASRKRFLGALPHAADTDPVDRDLATALVTVLAVRAGAWGVRVHDVVGTMQALDVADAWGRAAR